MHISALVYHLCICVCIRSSYKVWLIFFMYLNEFFPLSQVYPPHDFRIDSLSILPAVYGPQDASKLLSLCPSIQKAVKVNFIYSFK